MSLLLLLSLPVFACHSERSEEPPHFAFVVVVVVAVAIVVVVAIVVAVAVAVVVAVAVAVVVAVALKGCGFSRATIGTETSGL